MGKETCWDDETKLPITQVFCLVWDIRGFIAESK